MTRVPVTVFTGFLGSGKTTIIRNLVKQLPADYQVVWLKNEYGSINIDSELAKEQNITVSEMLNGCLCCVLVGKLENALQEIVAQYQPERIIIETSGTAYPAPIVWEIEKLPSLRLDAVITVIDALNFSGYHDKSYSAQLQAKYTDLFVINKTALIDEHELDRKLDDVYELNPETPKVRTADGFVSQELLLGIDSKIAQAGETLAETSHDDNVDTFGLVESHKTFDLTALTDYLLSLDPADFYRIKGIVKTTEGYQLINMVAGRNTSESLHQYQGPTKIAFFGRGIKGQEQMVTAKILTLTVNPANLGKQ